jgi:excisionase family DNA binding protein
MAMTLHGLPPSTPEPYLTRKQVAERMGLSLSTIDRFIAEGAPCERFGMRAVRFQWSQIIAWARERGRH